MSRHIHAGCPLDCTETEGPPWNAPPETVTLTREQLSDLLVSACEVGMARGGGGTRADVAQSLRSYGGLLRTYVMEA